MSFKPFYIHRQNNLPKRKRNHSMSAGFTMLIEPSEIPRTINVRVTLCSIKDEFSRKKGREEVSKKAVLAVNPRDLPKLIADTENKLYGGKLPLAYGYEEWVYKYML